VRLRGSTILPFILILFELLPAQTRQQNVALFGSLTTSSKIYHHSKDSDPEIRNQYFSIDEIWGIGINYRFPISDDQIEFSFSIEYLSAHTNKINLLDPSNQFNISDGYYAIPIEASSYFRIPIRIDPLNFYIGGGIGIYFGGRNLEIDGIRNHISTFIPGAGIHILTGFEYYLTSILSARSEIKFREIQFSSKSDKIELDNNSTLPFSIESADSRVSIDGLALSLGIVVRW
jgi:hypothetical protein